MDFEHFIKNKLTLISQPKFRYQQIQEALYAKLIEDWDEATNLPADLRVQLKKECPLNFKAQIFQKDKNNIKALLVLGDGESVETVLMRHPDGRNTICVSSQVGCPLNCSFCVTGEMGLKRNLSYGEIVAQVVFFGRILKKENARITNIVFMGMGEPFLNYENTWKAIEILHERRFFNIGARHISISTSGIPEGIKKLARENLQVNLAWSLHAPNDNLREKLMPIGKRHKIQQVINALLVYLNATNRKIMLEYILINGLNDSLATARELAILLRKLPRRLFVVNIIPCNPARGFLPSEPEKINAFKKFLIEHGIPLTERARYGRNIAGACGQLGKSGGI